MASLLLGYRFSCFPYSFIVCKAFSSRLKICFRNQVSNYFQEFKFLSSNLLSSNDLFKTSKVTKTTK